MRVAMASALMVECPECHAPPGSLCVNRTTGEYMGRGHVARSIISILPDGEVGGLEPDDPDEHIKPLGDIDTPQLDFTKDRYPDRTVLRWSRTYSTGTYIYTAIKAAGVGWFLTGKQQDAIQWDVLWNKHLMKADWVEMADHWEDIHIIHEPKGTT